MLRVASLLYAVLAEVKVTADRASGKRTTDERRRYTELSRRSNPSRHAQNAPVGPTRAYLKHLPVTGQSRQPWHRTPRCLFGFSLSEPVKSFAAFLACSRSSCREQKSSLHRGHFTASAPPDSPWYSAHTCMQEMWMLLPQPNLRGARTAT